MLGKSWSFSKYLAFENCPKALWFDERSRPHNRNLIPLYSLIGTSVHKAISFFVGNWSKNVVVSPKEVKKTGIAFIRDVWKNRKQTITEYFNDTEMDESLGSKFESSFSTLIDNFFGSLQDRVGKFTPSVDTGTIGTTYLNYILQFYLRILS